MDFNTRVAIFFGWICFAVMTIFSACASLNNIATQDFEITGVSIAKDYEVKEGRALPVAATDIFYKRDNQVVSLVQYANLTKSHYLRWEWYRPDGSLYFKTENYRIRASDGRIIERGSSLHHIPMAKINPNEMKGKWRVVVFLDDRLYTEKNFKIIGDFGNDHALLIGNDTYEAPELADLANAVYDIEELSQILSKHYGYEVNLLRNATREDIIDKLDLLRQKLTEQDNLLIYYAGHGWMDKEIGEGYWLPVDATQKGKARWISKTDISSALKAMKARHVLVVSDSCYAGISRGIGVVRSLPEKRSRLFISSGGLHPVYDGGGNGGHSIFASAFIRILRENKAVLQSSQLYKGLEEQVRISSPHLAPQIPNFGPIMGAEHEIDGDYYFVPLADLH